jgi:predicted metal-dependent HD superfamily phosphohydrolase
MRAIVNALLRKQKQLDAKLKSTAQEQKMNDLTTLIRENKRVQAVQTFINCILVVKPDIKHIHLTRESYDEYKAAIRDVNHVGNPYYRGVEIKRIGS